MSSKRILFKQDGHFKVKNTFLEFKDGEESSSEPFSEISEKFLLRRSNSADALRTSGRENSAENSLGSHSGSQGRESVDALVRSLKEWHTVWSSSSSSDAVVPTFGSQVQTRGTFDLEKALDFYWQVEELCSSQEKDVRDVIAGNFPDVNVEAYVPRDQLNNLLSLGSCRHLEDPIGTRCRPCGCFPRGKCYRSESCMYCHFYHPHREMGQNHSKKRANLSKRRRQRWKKNLARQWDQLEGDRLPSDDEVSCQPEESMSSVYPRQEPAPPTRRIISL